MKVECPSCQASGIIDESKVPANGRVITCPRCQHRFTVLPERTGVEIIQQRERMVCPKCSCEQERADSCQICSITIKEYLQETVKHQERERLEFVKLRNDSRAVDAWYSNLFDRRVSTLLVRVLSLLFLLGLFMTCSMNSARRNRFYAENSAEMRKITEGSTRKPDPTRNDPAFKERFSSVVATLSENTDLCMTQGYNYLTSWYMKGNQEHYLSESMIDARNRIIKNNSNTRSMSDQLPQPSQTYWDCYMKVKALHNLYKSVYSIAVDYQMYHSDLSKTLSEYNGEYIKLTGELNACKDSFK
jgi:predicted Zn finger-like uncharacterized protein